jgi:pilus assembly protein CpaC
MAAAAACAALAGPLAALPAHAQPEMAGAQASTRSLSLGKGKSAVIELPTDARDVLVTNPKVADAVLRTPRRIFILGVDTGQTDAVFFDQMGRRILSLDIRVDLDTNAVSETIRRVVPRAHIKVESVNQSLVLSGVAESASDADAAMRIAQQFVDKPDRVLNLIGIAGKEQVMLKVRVIEVQRTAIKQLGFNLSSVINQLGRDQFIFGLAPNFGVNGALGGGFSGGYQLDTTKQPVLKYYDPVTEQWYDAISPDNLLSVPKDSIGKQGLNKANGMLQALERVGMVRTLAEPNLTAISGESAKFLAGGEYPVPVGRDLNGLITVEFKPFGVGLGFTPVVLSDGRISLKISTEVSELTNAGSFTLSNGNNTPNLSIPALNVRRAETTVELPSGGAMMIAGLLQNKTKQEIDALPGTMNLPVLGALFRSRDFQNGETELVIIVTPYLVSPTSPSNLQTPADGLQVAGDSQAVLMGKLNKVTKGGSQAVQGRTYQGPYGYIIE